MPNITGRQESNYGRNELPTAPNGAFYNTNLPAGLIVFGYSGRATSNGNTATTAFDASRSNGLYGASTTVQPPAIALIPQIKF